MLQLDRFIPQRNGLDAEHGMFAALGGQENQGSAAAGSSACGGSGGSAGDGSGAGAGGSGAGGEAEYKKLLAASLNIHEQARVLAFKHKAPAPPEGHESGLAALYSANLGAAPSRKSFRHVPTTQERILDAPDLVDDYYLNLLDWSGGNVIAVALGATVYLWNAGTGSVEELCTCRGGGGEGDYVSSLQWAPDGSHLAVGTSDAKVQIWDAARARQVRELAGHANRVSALSWNGAILSSGGRDAAVVCWDVRKRKDEARVATLRAHDQEVCGLKWSPSGQQLASGGNDNLLCIWDARFQLQHKIAAHQAAVKALAWCPFQSNLLASGGGTADRHIRFWNTLTGAQLNAIDTGSQVCALQWSRHEREIVSSHGFSKNQLCLWRYPTLAKVGELTGHTARVLHMAQSPDGASVVTAGADETLRFWRVFGEPPAAAPKGDAKAATAAGTSASMLRSVSLR